MHKEAKNEKLRMGARCHATVNIASIVSGSIIGVLAGGAAS